MLSDLKSYVVVIQKIFQKIIIVIFKYFEDKICCSNKLILYEIFSKLFCKLK